MRRNIPAANLNFQREPHNVIKINLDMNLPPTSRNDENYVLRGYKS